jgi:anti-sigma-K factor RskA
MTDGRHIPQDDLALHAMQALSPDESAVVRAHLSECPACRAELAELAGDLALVAVGVEQHAVPAGARERFLQRIDADADSAAVAPQQSTAHLVSIDTARAPRRLITRIPWTAVAALLVITAGLLIKIGDLRRENAAQARMIQEQSAANARAQQVLDMLTSRSAQHILLTAAKSKPAPTARAVYMASRGALILQASNLDPVPAGKTYELWIIPMSGAPVPAGMFRPDAAGTASLVMPHLPMGITAKAFGVTVENEAGAKTPTMPIVLSGAAPAAGE